MNASSRTKRLDQAQTAPNTTTNNRPKRSVRVMATGRSQAKAGELDWPDVVPLEPRSSRPNGLRNDTYLARYPARNDSLICRTVSGPATKKSSFGRAARR